MHGGCFLKIILININVCVYEKQNAFLQEEDVHATKALLKNCSQYYHTLKITADCTERGFCKAPLECIRHDAVYNIMNFLTDIFFLSPKVSYF